MIILEINHIINATMPQVSSTLVISNSQTFMFFSFQANFLHSPVIHVRYLESRCRCNYRSQIDRVYFLHQLFRMLPLDYFLRQIEENCLLGNALYYICQSQLLSLVSCFSPLSNPKQDHLDLLLEQFEFCSLTNLCV